LCGFAALQCGKASDTAALPLSGAMRLGLIENAPHAPKSKSGTVGKASLTALESGKAAARRLTR